MGQTRTITAQLSATPKALARLLSVSGTESDFVLVSRDGSTAVRVGLAVSSVPDAQLPIGSKGAVLDWSRSTVSYRGNQVSLTRMELRLLVALLEVAPEPASREHLVAKMWGRACTTACRGKGVGENVLPVWIRALRCRLATIGLQDVIRTVRKVGYALVCP